MDYFKIVYTDKLGKQKIAKYKCNESEAIKKVKKRKGFLRIENVIQVLVLIPKTLPANRFKFAKVDENQSNFYL